MLSTGHPVFEDSVLQAWSLPRGLAGQGSRKMPLSASSTRITSPSRCAQVYVAPGLVPGYSCPGAPDRLPGPQQAAPSKARPGCGSCQESKAVVHSALHVTSMLVTLRVPLLTSWKACGLSVQGERMIEGPERRPSGGEHRLLPERTQACTPAPSRRLTITRKPVPGAPVPSPGLVGTSHARGTHRDMPAKHSCT